MVLRYLSILAVLFFTGAASAQTYPTKPIRILTSGIGGGSDLITRMIAGGISGPLGQPIVVDNRGGMITAEVLSKSPPDGYTLMLMGSAVWLVQFLYDNVPFDATRDFTPITVADASPNLVLVHPSVPAKSLKELIALAKAKPGALNWSSGATGAAGHLAGELFKSITGVDIVRIPYKSGSLELADFLAGRVDMSFWLPSSAIRHVKAGKLRALAVSTNTPSALAPGVPTAAEAGLPAFVARGSHNVFAPAGTPAAIINRLNQEMVRFLKLPDTRVKLLEQGVEPVANSPEEASAWMKSEMARVGKIIKDLGIRGE